MDRQRMKATKATVVVALFAAATATAAPVAWTDGIYHFDIVPGHVNGIASDPYDTGDSGSRYKHQTWFEGAIPGGTLDLVVSGNGTLIDIPAEGFHPDPISGTPIGSVQFGDHVAESGKANQYTIPAAGSFSPGGTVTGDGHMHVNAPNAYFNPSSYGYEMTIPLRLWTAPWESPTNHGYNYGYKVDGSPFDGQNLRLVSTGTVADGPFATQKYQMVLELSLAPQVPEPTSVGLVGGVVAGLLAWVRRRRAA
ncbi:MAG: hypothetical protein CO080_11875 [Nitrospirae bacterium CG_4_9_14_0_8_um_filter_70_14]|nr:MAG: hypothetical protein CO080_11875 [Nitrospirae bacterium CG_4_9_14_0_8_um_filter_70_14]